MTLPSNRPPIGPGEILRDFLTEMEITQTELAQHIGWPIAKINELINAKRGVTTEVALCLADTFGNSPEFWLNAQRAIDLYKTRQQHKKRSPIRRVS
ncbi:MAG: HigA family addiction module antitoxin [Vampirovibrionales bacterium]|nr:HigA family addiction module antitoxin [Vampirovibrionales bacterium]